MNDPYQPLFDYLDAELGVAPLQTQMQEIIDICLKLPLKDHAWPANIQPFADGLAAHGFRLSRGTYKSPDEATPTWNIDRLFEQDFLPVFDCADQGDDEARIVALIGRAFAKWEAAQ
jgi:hypothetical protein